MSIEILVIRDVEGERYVEKAELPLRVGTGNDSDLRLPGPGSGPVFLLDLVEGVPIVQPMGQSDDIVVNGEPLPASRRVADGDVLGFFGSRIALSVAGDRLALDVKLEDSAYVTQPPVVDADVGDEQIEATPFQRASEVRAPVVASHGHRLRVIVGAAMGLLLVMSYLVFSAQSVQVRVEPADPDRVEITGGWFRLPIGERILMRRGDYTVVVEKQGYYPVSQNFEVGAEDSKVVAVELRKRPGTLTVAVDGVADARVTVDGTLVGSAPFGPLELQPGLHTVSVRSDRYLPYDGGAEIRGLGQHREMHVELVPRWAAVSVSSEPAGATIYAGGNQIGTTPATVEFLEGTHDVSLVHPEFKAWDTKVIAEPNVPQTLPLVRLEPADASLQVNTVPRGAHVTVNGHYRGQSPLTLSLSPDIDYEIGLTRAGYGSSRRNIRLRSGAQESVFVDLSARTGSVTVAVQPGDAQVLVDGKLRSTGSRTLTLSAVPHKIEVRKAGFEGWSKTVTPRPGYPQTVTASLRSEADVARSKMATSVEAPNGQVLRRVEPGTFRMGSPRSEAGRRANEVLVPVTITQPFFISEHEVTNKAFADFKPGHDSGSDLNPALSGNNNPVANVTWADAVQYCNWLSALEGLTPVYTEKFGEWVAIHPFPNGYRLPTEAEWAWSLRFAGNPQATTYPWGDTMPPRRDSGNFADRSASNVAPSVLLTYDDGYATSAPVGKFGANALGLYDGGGNVSEWVNDYYSTPTPGLTSAVRDPLGPPVGKAHVVRGSSWRHGSPGQLRMSYRDGNEEARPDLGFRIARNVE